MALFGLKKKEGPVFPQMPDERAQQIPQPDISQPPTSLVIQMRQQGFNNNQVVQALQREGFKSQQIFDAMNQADTKTGVGITEPTELERQQSPENPVQPSVETIPESVPMGDSMAMNSREEIEEVAESIVEEKMEEMVKDSKKVAEWREKTDDRLSKIEQQISDLKTSFDSLHKGVLGKIEEYDKGITDVGTEIKALEKVFQKILPTLTENVGELSRITKSMKSKTAPSKK